MDFLNQINEYQWVGIFLHFFLLIGLISLFFIEKKKKKEPPKKPTKKTVWFPIKK